MQFLAEDILRKDIGGKVFEVHPATRVLNVKVAGVLENIGGGYFPCVVVLLSRRHGQRATMRSASCRIALGLWIVTIAVAGWFFVEGWTAEGTDGRMTIVLAPTERDLILGEIRTLLKAVHGVVTGLAGQD